MLTFEEYRDLVEKIPFGKRLPTAIYVHVDGLRRISGTLREFLTETLEATGDQSTAINIIKFHRSEFRLSLLSYPAFFSDPHPPLNLAITINLNNLTATQRRYSPSQNRPILHRKETFLPLGHSRYEEFRALTASEEQLGLYCNVSKIGLEDHWNSLLESTGISFDGHTVLVRQRTNLDQVKKPSIDHHQKVHRSRTAISRFGLSLPVRNLLKFEVLSQDQTFFDYGCGQGDDVRALQKLGYSANGWDPLHNPEALKQGADIVNLGFVLNVIEDPSERLTVLRDAYVLASKLLVVAVQVKRGGTQEEGEPLLDGVLTSRGTFQRFFAHHEIGQILEGTLNTVPVPVGPGIFFVFKDPAEAQKFLEKRTSRPIDFRRLHEEVFGTKPKRTPRSPHVHRRSFYESHQELLDDYWEVMLQIGRPPSDGEYHRFDEILALGLSPQKAKNLHMKLFGAKALDQGFLERNRSIIDSYWDSLVELGRIPSENEFDRNDDFLNLGVSPEQLKNLYLRTHGQGSLQHAFRDRHRELIESFWRFMISLGRVPDRGEFHRHGEMTRLTLSPKRLYNWFVEEFGEDVFEKAVRSRKDDLLVYLALANFKQKIPFRYLPAQLQVDLRNFFGSYQRALELGRVLLFSLGNAGAVAHLCDAFPSGWQDSHSLYIHKSLIDQLPPELRVLLGCAENLEGDLLEADIIKIHKTSSKVSLLIYDNFERRTFPVLRERIKVDLAERTVHYFDHSMPNKLQILGNKHLFVGPYHPKFTTWKRFHKRVERLIGEPDNPHLYQDDLRKRLASSGFDLRLRKLVAVSNATEDHESPG